MWNFEPLEHSRNAVRLARPDPNFPHGYPIELEPGTDALAEVVRDGPKLAARVKLGGSTTDLELWRAAQAEAKRLRDAADTDIQAAVQDTEAYQAQEALAKELDVARAELEAAVKRAGEVQAERQALLDAGQDPRPLRAKVMEAAAEVEDLSALVRSRAAMYDRAAAPVVRERLRFLAARSVMEREKVKERRVALKARVAEYCREVLAELLLIAAVENEFR